jgi:hypothetical protein
MIQKPEKFGVKEGGFIKRLALAGLLLSGASCATGGLNTNPKPTATEVSEMVVKERNDAMFKALKQLGDFERPGWHIDGGLISCAFADDEETAKEIARKAALKEVEKAGIAIEFYIPEFRYAIENLTKDIMVCVQEGVKK